MQMKAILVCLMLLLSPVVYAQENAVDPGITPDSFLYGLDVALDKIDMLLTFDQAKKSKKGLKIAQERLQEVREMAIKNKLEAMGRAQREHDDVLETVMVSVANIEKENSTEEIKAEIEIEKELEKHKQKIEEVRGELEIKIKVKGEITPQQQGIIDEILTRLKNASGKVEIEIKNKKEKTKIKIKTKTGKSDDEIESEFKAIEEKKGLKGLKMEKAMDEMEDAREAIGDVRSLLDVNASVPTLLVEALEHLTKAETAFNESDYGEAYGQAKAAKDNAKALKKQLEKDKKETDEDEAETDRLRVKVEVEVNQTKVKVEYGEEELEFTQPTTNMAAVVAEIAERTGLAMEDIEAAMKFEDEEDNHGQAFELGNKTAEKEKKERGGEEREKKHKEEEHNEGEEG